ncbi:MAG: hypothetical protein ABIS18_11680 [Actinomycetota bacterium]
MKIAKKYRRDDTGVALLVALFTVAIIALFGGVLAAISVRELKSSVSVNRASSALGIAEAGVQHGLQQIRQVGPFTTGLSALVPDKSADGFGRWMNPTDPKLPPSGADQFQGQLGTGGYSAYIIAMDPVDMPDKPQGLYKIVVMGTESRNAAVRQGTRQVEQDIEVQARDLPYGLYAEDSIQAGGTGQIKNMSVYTGGDIYWRSKITFQGIDQFNGGPTAAHAVGVIYRGNGKKGESNGPIHPPYANCEFPYDRDSKGGLYPVPWPCSPVPAPAYSPFSSKFDSSMLPTDSDGLTEEVYEALKQSAISSGTYFTHAANSTLVIQSPDLAPVKSKGIKFFVLYVDVTGTGAVSVKTGWGPQSIPPNPCDGSFGLIVIRGGDLRWENNEYWWGAAFVPEGEFSGAGSSQFVGTVMAKTIGSTGNITFSMDDCWQATIPGAFFSVHKLRWHERDR